MIVGPPITNGDHAPMMDKNNIINVRDGESLYQICLKLRRRLSDVPGFKTYLEEMESQEAEGSDPVSSLWQCFRSGLPLLAIYNASQPEEGDLRVNTNKREDKIGKEAAFLFIKACMQQMNIPAADTFTLTDLYSDNTTGFVKVTKLINRVLDLLNMSGKLQHSTDSDDSRDGADGRANGVAKKQLTRREHILRELVETERQYVHHLLNLQALKKELEEIGALTGDSIHNIFLNLNNLLDFAQRFLIRIEQQNELPEEQQNWGKLFIRYKEPFLQYEPFIANQRRCETTCQKEWDKMVGTIRTPLMQQMLAGPTILNGFLLKPFQRLTKYPLLLKDLQKQVASDELKNDIATAIEIIQEVLQQADASIDKETRDDALRDLEDRVDDWKSLQLHQFGELLLLGTFSVLKEGLRDQEKEYHIYLFSRILIMCKEVNMNKQKNKIMGNKEKSTLSLRGKPRMHLKGRIYLINISNVISSSGPGNYLIQIIWKGDPSTESFMIKFKNDETMKKWNHEIETQRALCISEAKQSGTSATHFTSLGDIHNMENPYQDADDEDYSRMSGTTFGGTESNGYSDFSMSRNASNTSLRSRSATGGSGGSTSTAHNSIGRNPRYMMPDLGGLPPLNTKLSRETQSPGDYGGGSYFSPIERDPTPPASTRSSSQSAHAGYHRNGTPLSVLGRPEDSYRNTAPAMARNITSGNGNPYLANGRSAGARPSLPPGAVQSANQVSSISRNRSASSPDVNPNFQQNRKYASGDNVPVVPPIPPHVAKQMAAPNRSQNSSPNNVLPIRNGGPSYSGQPHYGPGSRPVLTNHTYTYDPSYTGHNHVDPRKMGHVSGPTQMSGPRTLSPPLTTPSSDVPFMPSQLRAKVQFDDNYVSMIIPSNIQFRSLTDRIDAKLSRFTNHSIASGSVRLRYQDEDGDFIWIDSDEAVHDALLDWRETHADKVINGQYAEIMLYAHSIVSEPS